MAGLAREVAATAQARSMRHRFVVQAPTAVPALVDPQRLEQVLLNLLDNAYKHSPDQAPIEVEVSTPAPETVRISVRDHGPGIPPQERAHLFERFHQVRPGSAMAGLGLHISRRIVAQHGGRLEAEFPEDGGSRFVVELPAG